MEYGTTGISQRRVAQTNLAGVGVYPVKPLPDMNALVARIRRPTLTTETVLTIPEDRSRCRIGVGESVMMECSSKVFLWVAKPADRGKIVLTGENTAYFIASDKGGPVTVTATTGRECLRVVFTIVEPEALVIRRIPGTEIIHQFQVPGCGWLGRPYLEPVDVNFAYVSIRERNSQVTGTGGLACFSGAWHGEGYLPADCAEGASAWMSMRASEYSSQYGSTVSSDARDIICSLFGGVGKQPPFYPGTLITPLLWEWTTDQITPHPFPLLESKTVLTADGSLTISKGRHSETSNLLDPDSGLSYTQKDYKRRPDVLSVIQNRTMNAGNTWKHIGPGERLTVICNNPVSSWGISNEARGTLLRIDGNKVGFTALDQPGEVTLTATTDAGKVNLQLTVVVVPVHKFV